jgi:hypothetical protein
MLGKLCTTQLHHQPLFIFKITLRVRFSAPFSSQEPHRLNILYFGFGLMLCQPKCVEKQIYSDLKFNFFEKLTKVKCVLLLENLELSACVSNSNDPELLYILLSVSLLS